MSGKRKLLYTPDRLRALFNRMRSDLHDMHFKHQCELAELRKQLDEVRDLYTQLRAATLARPHAEDELASLYRQRELVRAQAAEREPWQPLQ